MPVDKPNPRFQPVPRSGGGRPVDAKTNDSSFSVTSPPFKIILGGISILAIFSLTFLILGAIYVNHCKLEPMVPVWLIVTGVVVIIFSSLVSFEMKRKKSNSFGYKPSLPSKILGVLLSLFLLAWFIAGNVWIYSGWGLTPDYQHYWFENGCNKSVYLLSFWGIIFMDAIVGLSIIAGLAVFVFSFCKRDK